jgi:hypothetical protein
VVNLEGRRATMDSQALAMSDSEEKTLAVRKTLTTLVKSKPNASCCALL